MKTKKFITKSSVQTLTEGEVLRRIFMERIPRDYTYKSIYIHPDFTNGPAIKKKFKAWKV